MVIPAAADIRGVEAALISAVEGGILAAEVVPISRPAPRRISPVVRHASPVTSVAAGRMFPDAAVPRFVQQGTDPLRTQPSVT